MRPYIAIIKDSFRAAMASRVLFVLLLLISSLLLALAPLHVQPITDAGGTPKGLDFFYAIWKLPASLNISQQQFARMVTAELPFYFEKFVMSIGLLIAIIVTANMIPETFEPGSLNLLLSKPLFRWGLYSAKFFGGCVFIFLLAGYLFIGLWLWLGLAMGIWDRAILLSIPLYVLVFAIYFSVSAFVGLVSRSPIMAVILTGCFWAFCFVIGSVYGSFHTKMRNNEWIHLLPVGKTVVASDVLHQVSVWDETQRKWVERITADLGSEEEEMAIGLQAYMIPMRDVPSVPRLHEFVAPVHDRQHDQVLASRYKFAQFFSSGKQPLWSAADSELRFSEMGQFPRDTVQLFETVQARNADSTVQTNSTMQAVPGIVAVTSNGELFRMATETDSSAVSADSEEHTDQSSTPRSARKFTFESIGPKNRKLIRDAGCIAYSRLRDEFVIYRNGKLTFWEADLAPAKGEYRESREIDLELDFDGSMTARIAYVRDTVLIAWGNGVVRVARVDQIEEKTEYHPESRSGIREVGISPSGRYFAVLYRNGNLWWLNHESNGQRSHEFELAPVIGQGSVSTFAFSTDLEDSLGTEYIWVADNSDRVTRYEIDGELQQQTRLAPAGGWVEMSYRYLIRPIYTICPKPGEFYKVVTQLATSGDTRMNRDIDLNQALERRDPWSPLKSGLVFMFTMLMLGCLVFQFRDY